MRWSWLLAASLFGAEAFAGVAQRAQLPEPTQRRATQPLSRSRGGKVAPPLRLVKGVNSPPLLLDIGRDLHSLPLTRREAIPAGLPRLSSLEKVRLDARRIFSASHLDPKQKISRLISIVMHRLPNSPGLDARYDQAIDRLAAAGDIARLSTATRTRFGVCKERAFLLSEMLAEGGIRGKVVHGHLFDQAGQFLGEHAWVEARLDGQRVLLDPAAPKPIDRIQSERVTTHDEDEGAKRHTMHRTSNGVYQITEPFEISELHANGEQ
jgi:hypothetical protein